MKRVLFFLSGVALFICPVAARAGLYYSGEGFAELPSQWRGFLLDQRTLRNIAMKPKPGSPASPAHIQYQQEAIRLEREKGLTADELADLGALYVRLGEAGKAVGLLRGALRDHPNHFYIAANLGTAWQLQGDLQQAAFCLSQAVRLAPGKQQLYEEYHLKLIQFRLRQGAGFSELDDLFGVKYIDEKGEYQPSKMSPLERKKLPARAVAIVQQLSLWLPGDARLLWQLAELANAHGDVKSAAAMMDGCVTAFNWPSQELRRHRQVLRAAADQAPAPAVGAKAEHDKHPGFAPRSKRPLISRLDLGPLPAVSDTGTNEMPWELLAETALDDKYRPTFPKYLHELNGKTVSLNGFIIPIREDLELAAFMFIEFPVGCWYCEMPNTNQIVYVELPRGKTARYQRSLVRVQGQLWLNANDPEDFLYHIKQARVGAVD